MKKKKECERQVEILDIRSESESFEGSFALLFEFELASFDFCYSLNIVCLLRNEGVPSFRLCASLFCVEFRRSKGRHAPPFE